LDTSEELFDGSIFLGDDAVRLGLADDFGSMDQTMKAKYGNDIKLVKPKRALRGLQDLFQMVHDGADNAVSTLGHSIGAGVVDRTAARAENEVVERRFRFRT
jgi:ClpP class serine protease